MHQRLLSFPTLRKVPRQCSGVDQRLVRKRSIDPLSHEACPLYLFLGTVADAPGLSYDSERALCPRLSRTPLALHQARQALSQLGLVAYDHPLYQVLALDEEPLVPAPGPPRMPAADKPMALKDIFTPIAATLS